MKEKELQAFLDGPLTATVCTISFGGKPHGVPVWYRFRDGVFVVWTESSRQWVRNVRRRPDVSIVVAEHAPPFAAVVAQGTAQIATEEPVGNQEVRLITQRYVAAEEVEAYIARWSQLTTIVRVKAQQIRSWSRGF